jgi:hypothetical protein
MKNPLSGRQIGALCSLASKAFKLALARFDPRATEAESLEAYRHAGQDEALVREGVSLTECTQNDFLPLRGFWFVQVGNLAAAFADFMAIQDEDKRRAAWRLAGGISHLAEGIAAEKLRAGVTLTEADAAEQARRYAWTVCADKFHGRKPPQLDASELRQLAHTCIGRGNAKRGVGRPENRNKKQRESRRGIV